MDPSTVTEAELLGAIQVLQKTLANCRAQQNNRPLTPTSQLTDSQGTDEIHSPPLSADGDNGSLKDDGRGSAPPPLLLRRGSKLQTTKKASNTLPRHLRAAIANAFTAGFRRRSSTVSSANGDTRTESPEPFERSLSVGLDDDALTLSPGLATPNGVEKDVEALRKERDYWRQKYREMKQFEMAMKDSIAGSVLKSASMEEINEIVSEMLQKSQEGDQASRGSESLSTRQPLRRAARTNSELRLLADAIESKTDVQKSDSPTAEDEETRETLTSFPYHELSANVNDTDGKKSALGDDFEWEPPSLPIVKQGCLRLLKCSDERCEVFHPPEGRVAVSHASRTNVQLLWDKAPGSVLMIMKPGDTNVNKAFLVLSTWLMQEKDINVLVEEKVHRIWKDRIPGLVTYTDEQAEYLHQMVDFVICLGGDGTVLFAARLFEQAVPPIVAFAMGSLGFLTSFEVEKWQSYLEKIIGGGFYVSLRSRLRCRVVRATECQRPEPSDCMSDDVSSRWFNALNEVVVDRGPSAALVDLDCYYDGYKFTKVQADGIIVATPSGSTAYSLSAGGSVTHPSVPCMLFTPICPHTLSFRPLILPDSARLNITVPRTSRTSAFVSFDGQNRLELRRGDSIFIKVSTYPVPVISKETESRDWFTSLKVNLHWNTRQPQKPFCALATPSRKDVPHKEAARKDEKSTPLPLAPGGRS